MAPLRACCTRIVEDIPVRAVANHRGTETQRSHRDGRLSSPANQRFSGRGQGHLSSQASPLSGGSVTERVIGAAIAVHRHLGPGLLESAYEECLCWELSESGVSYARQVALPIIYKGVRLDRAYSIDLIVERRVVVELKAVGSLAPVHEAQLLTYLKLTGIKIGLLLNFNAPVLRDGIRRFVL